MVYFDVCGGRVPLLWVIATYNGFVKASCTKMKISRLWMYLKKRFHSNLVETVWQSCSHESETLAVTAARSAVEISQLLKKL